MKKGKGKTEFVNRLFYWRLFRNKKRGRMYPYYVCIDSERCTNFIDLRIQAETGCVNPENVFGVVNHNGLAG